MDGESYDACDICDRNHVRLNQTHHKDTLGRYETVGTPHFDQTVWCGAVRKHRAQSYLYTRNYIAGGMSYWYGVSYQNWGNTQPMRQCDGSYTFERRSSGLGQHRMRGEPNMRRMLALFAVVAAAAGGGLAWAAGPGGGSSHAARAPQAPPGQDATGLSCSPVAGHFDAGLNFKGHALERVRQCEPATVPIGASPASMPPGGGGVNAELAVYGTCDPGDEGGCAPPLSIQTWDACERNYAQYAANPAPDGSVVPHQRIRLRGIDGAIFDDGHRVELYGRRVTIVIFADDPAVAMAAARGVRGEVGGRAVGPGDAIPSGTPAAC
jgi:hypothetical protein